MDKKLLESLKKMSREERTEYFSSHKTEILSESSLEAVNGGAGSSVKNPNTAEVPFEGNYYTSWGFTCNGIEQC